MLKVGPLNKPKVWDEIHKKCEETARRNFMGVSAFFVFGGTHCKGGFNLAHSWGTQSILSVSVPYLFYPKT